MGGAPDMLTEFEDGLNMELINSRGDLDQGKADEGHQLAMCTAGRTKTLA